MQCDVRDNFLGAEILCMAARNPTLEATAVQEDKTKCIVQCLPRGQRLPWKKRALLLEVSCSSLEAALV